MFELICTVIIAIAGVLTACFKAVTAYLAYKKEQKK